MSHLEFCNFCDCRVNLFKIHSTLSSFKKKKAKISFQSCFLRGLNKLTSEHQSKQTSSEPQLLPKPKNRGLKRKREDQDINMQAPKTKMRRYQKEAKEKAREAGNAICFLPTGFKLIQYCNDQMTFQQERERH